jgi:2-phosphoglycerate kinase
MEVPRQEIYEELKMKHLKENNENYLEHMKHAMGISLLLMEAGAKCLIHSIIPPLFDTAVSSKLDDIIALVRRNETTT